MAAMTQARGRSAIDLTRGIVVVAAEARWRCTLPSVHALVTGGGGFLGSTSSSGSRPMATTSSSPAARTTTSRRWRTQRACSETPTPRSCSTCSRGRRNRRQPGEPGRYWYANLTMGRTSSSRRGCRDGEARDRRNGVLVPEVRGRPVQRGGSLGRISRGDERALRRCEEAVLVGAQAYREQYGLSSIFLLPTNLYGPRTTSTSRRRTSSRR